MDMWSCLNLVFLIMVRPQNAKGSQSLHSRIAPRSLPFSKGRFKNFPGRKQDELHDEDDLRLERLIKESLDEGKTGKYRFLRRGLIKEVYSRYYWLSWLNGIPFRFDLETKYLFVYFHLIQVVVERKFEK